MWPNNTIIIKNSIVADNKIGLFSNVAGPNPITHDHADNKIIYQDMLVVGQTSNFDCHGDNQPPFHASFLPSGRSPRAPTGIPLACDVLIN